MSCAVNPQKRNGIYEILIHDNIKKVFLFVCFYLKTFFKFNH